MHHLPIEINNTQTVIVNNTDVVIPMYNSIEYSDNYYRHLKVYDNITVMKQILL